MLRTSFFAAFGLLCSAASAAQPSSPAAAPAGPPPPACSAPEHRQFDFWIGSWDVYPTGKSTLIAHSLIEKLYGDCTIRENWMPLKNSGGGSLNMYDPRDKRWHQTWHDGQNSRVEFDGGLVDGKMVLMGFWPGVLGPGDAWVRIEWSRSPDGSVRQHGLQSANHGMSWEESFDLTYKKRGSALSN